MPAILLGKGTNRVGLGLATRCIATLDINDAMSACRLAAPQTLVAAAGPSMAGIAADKAKAKNRAMRDLFTTIDDRIDFGIVFAGFDAADLGVIRYEATAPDWRDASALSVGGALG